MSIETPQSIEITAPRARQAYRGRRTLWVLAASLCLVVAALFGTWALRSGQLAGAEQPTVSDHPTARTFEAPEGLQPPKRPS
jgi:hypothetical protein